MKYFLTYKVFLYVHLYQIINCCALEFMCIIIFICLFGFFFSFYFITTCSWYFSYNIVNKMFDLFLLRLNIEMIEKRFLVEHRKLDLNCMVFPRSFLDWPCLIFPPFHLSLTFFTNYPNNTTPINPFTNAFAEKKKGFFCLLLCFQHQTLKLKASLAQLYTVR